MPKIQSVLLIEDDRLIGDMYLRGLQRAGLAVTWKTNGDDGLIAARDNQFDLMIVDVLLPGKNGLEILEALRGGEDLVPNTKVIVLTNYDVEQEQRAVAASKCDAYLLKAEITPKRLVEIIKQLED